VKIEVLKAEGALRDCTVGKVYNGLYTKEGMTLQGNTEIAGDGATFFDDVGDQVEALFSNGNIKLVTE